MRVSLIIPTMNKLPRLKLAICSIGKQVIEKELFEVIIVNDGSTDETNEYLMSLKVDYNLRVIHQKNAGRAAARNIGMRAAKNEIIIFSDDDLILAPDFIEEHRKAQETKAAVYHGKIINLPFLKFFKDPSKGIFYDNLNGKKSSGGELTKKCITESDIINHFEEKVACSKSITSMEKLIRRVLEDNDTKIPWIGFTGGNVSIPREWIIEGNGFDEQFGLNWGCEDLELGYRLFQQNRTIKYCEKAINYHIAHYRADFSLQHEKNTDYFYEKYKDGNIIKFHQYAAGKISDDELLRSVR